MKEPDLEEEALRATVQGARIELRRQTMAEGFRPVTMTGPDGKTQTFTLNPVAPGRAIAGIGVDKPGVYRFDDGEKTYVQMREQILHRELPILVVVGTQGPEMVNYRVKGTVYVVDRIFEHGALILGEGKKAKRLDIVRGTFRGKVKGDGFSASFSGKPEVER